jgi:GNAT superfamily N-acetyltransferase
MVTYFLGKEEVSAYLRDFLVRLEQLDAVPTLWCPLTRSGNALLDELLDLARDHHPKLVETVSVLPIEVRDKMLEVRFTSGDPAKDIRGQNVLIFDGATHSGRMMTKCVAEVLRHGAATVCTYSLVLKRGSAFVPTMWGLAVDDVDRAFFLLDQIPNHRLDAGGPENPKKKKGLNVHLRLLSEAHLKQPPVVCGLSSMDRVTWSDRYFEMKTGGQRHCTYVLEKGDQILGFMSLTHREHGCRFIDEIAVDQKHQGKNIGPMMIRFADTMARQFDCVRIQLQAIANRREFYAGFGYKLMVNSPLLLDDEEYWLMEKPAIGSQSPLT